MTEAAALLATKLAGRYEVVDVLGRGGMGVVYRGRDPVLNRDVAIKLVPTSATDKETEGRFLREAQVVAQLDHPCIVPIYDFGRHESSLFFVMPLVPGSPLRSFLQDRSLRLGDVVDIGIQVLEALDYSHSRGVVHRDVKPENVMVARDESGGVRIRVMDFGLARTATDDRLTKSGIVLGTVSYVSPEQAAAEPVDGRSDVYSLASVLYECLLGDPPFVGTPQAVLYRIVHEAAQPLRSLGVTVDEELDDLVIHALAKEPWKRPQRASEMAEALRAYRAKLHESDRIRSVEAGASRVRPGARPAPSPLIGRKRELAELQRRLNAAQAGECQLVLLSGEAGIGKTRLMSELEALARGRRFLVLHGRFVEREGAFPYQGFCDLIREYFRGKEASAPHAADLTDLAPDLISLFPVLLEIETLRTSAPSTGTSRARKAEDRVYLFELLARTLSRIAGGKPALFLLENLQRAEISIEALSYILQRLGPTPTLVAASFRPSELDRRHPLLRMVEERADDPRGAVLRLEPLPASDTRAFVESLIPEAKVAPQLSERLFSWTEGNPLFTKELVRSLLASGGIVDDGSGTFVLSPDAELSADAVPVTIQQAVEKRVERLTDELREVLLNASVLGKAFSYEDLEIVLDSRAGAEAAVDRLISEGLLEEERGSRGARLSFISGVVRDLVYAQVPRRRRRTLHRRFGEALEQRHAGRLDRVLPHLYYHFSQGDVPEKAVQYGLRTARRSLEAFGPEDAVRTLKTCLEFLIDEGWEGDRALLGEAREMLAEAHRMAGNIDGALHEAESAVRVFEKAEQTARAVRTLLFGAETAWHARRTDDAGRLLRRGIALARLDGGAEGGAETLSRLLTLGATLASLRGDAEEAVSFMDEVDRLAPATEVESPAPAGGTLVVALANPPHILDPACVAVSEEHEVLANVFETLLAMSPHGQVTPLLCERFTEVDGGRSFVLTLRPDVTFSDGAPLDAALVKASFERAAPLARHDLPAALAAIRGTPTFLEDEVTEIPGLVVRSSHVLEVSLVEPLPVYPSLLTDPRMGITRRTSRGLLGTGPFVLAPETEPLEEDQSPPSGRVVRLLRNPRYWKGSPPLLDALEFRVAESAAVAIDGLRSGAFDLVRDIPPHELDELLRDERKHIQVVEAPRANTFFVLFSEKSPLGRNPFLRQALAGVVKPHDLVWRSIGRFALPATSLIPPGILGHDPGRRRGTMGKERSLGLLRKAGVSLPLRLTAAVHPLLQDRYRSLLTALFSVWSELGVEVSIETPSMESFLVAFQTTKGIDLFIGRWEADYADPDDFCYSLFHSRIGLFRNYFSSPEVDHLAEEARGEGRVTYREALYKRFESLLAEEAVLIPLFHEIDYRVARSGLLGLKLRASAPFVSYEKLAKPQKEQRAAWQPGGGVLHVPILHALRSLDPARVAVREHAEVIPNVFETLTRVIKGARAFPWLASEFHGEDGGRRYRFRLREGVRFHDGRRLTARDVRFTYERLLVKGDQQGRRLLLPIFGARALAKGEANDLEGFRILSALEFTIDLEHPVPFFPELLSDAPTAILPEGADPVGGSWRDRCVGTGPFRVVQFAPGDELELERNPLYWREGYPRAEGLVFSFRAGPAQILEDFRAGNLSVASDLLPGDVETLRHDPTLGAGYRETPRLSTFWVAFNIYRGPMADLSLRQRVFAAVDVAALVQRTLGRLALPAHGLIPPGLLGHEKARRARRSSTGISLDALQITAASRNQPEPTTGKLPENVELLVAISPVFADGAPYAELAQDLFSQLGKTGFRVKVLNQTYDELDAIVKGEHADLVLARWGADYPDADSFVHGVLHTEEGVAGRFCGSAELDRAIENGRAEADPAIRHTTYRHIESMLRERSLLLPLFHEQIYRFVRPEIEGLSPINFLEPVLAYENLRVRK